MHDLKKVAIVSGSARYEPLRCAATANEVGEVGRRVAPERAGGSRSGVPVASKGSRLRPGPREASEETRTGRVDRLGRQVVSVGAKRLAPRGGEARHLTDENRSVIIPLLC